MDLQTFSAMTRDAMFAHLSAEAAKIDRSDLAKGKSRARKDALIAAYTELLYQKSWLEAMVPAAPEPAPVAYPETPETIIIPEPLPAPPEPKPEPLPEIEATYNPGHSVYGGGGHALDRSGSVTLDQVGRFAASVSTASIETTARPSVRVRITDGHSQRRLPHGATTSSELQRARVAKKQRNRLKHRKALARKRHGWANGVRMDGWRRPHGLTVAR